MWGLSLELDGSVPAATQVSPKQEPRVLKVGVLVVPPDL